MHETGAHTLTWVVQFLAYRVLELLPFWSATSFRLRGVVSYHALETAQTAVVGRIIIHTPTHALSLSAFHTNGWRICDPKKCVHAAFVNCRQVDVDKHEVPILWGRERGGEKGTWQTALRLNGPVWCVLLFIHVETMFLCRYMHEREPLHRTMVQRTGVVGLASCGRQTIFVRWATKLGLCVTRRRCKVAPKTGNRSEFDPRYFATAVRHPYRRNWSETLHIPSLDVEHRYTVLIPRL